MKCYRVRFEVEKKVRAVDEFDAVDVFFRKLVEGIANADLRIPRSRHRGGWG